MEITHLKDVSLVCFFYLANELITNKLQNILFNS